MRAEFSIHLFGAYLLSRQHLNGLFAGKLTCCLMRHNWPTKVCVHVCKLYKNNTLAECVWCVRNLWLFCGMAGCCLSQCDVYTAVKNRFIYGRNQKKKKSPFLVFNLFLQKEHSMSDLESKKRQFNSSWTLSIPFKKVISFLNLWNLLWWGPGKSKAPSSLQCHTAPLSLTVTLM